MTTEDTEVLTVEAVEQDRDLLKHWYSQANTAPFFPVEAHPDLIRHSQTASDARLLVWRDKCGQAAATALIRQKQIRLQISPGRFGFKTLRGFRLVGNQLLSGGDAIRAESICEGLSRLLNCSSSHCEAILCESILKDNGLYPSLCRGLNSNLFRSQNLGQEQAHHRLRFPSDSESYWKGFSGKTRYNFRRARKKLGAHLRVFEQPADVECFLTTAQTISESSWQHHRIGPRISKTSATAQYYRDLANLGALRCYVLYLETRPIAFAIGTQWNGMFRLEETGFDSELSKQSPGTVLLLDVIEDLLERNRPRMLDFGFGDAQYKQLFGNETSTSANVLLASNSLRTKLTLGLYASRKKIESGLRSALRTTGLTERVRQHHRRQCPSS